MAELVGTIAHATNQAVRSLLTELRASYPDDKTFQDWLNIDIAPWLGKDVISLEDASSRSQSLRPF